MKTRLVLMAALWVAPALAQTPPAPAAPAAGPTVSGEVTTGVLGVDNSTNSAKFTEYRDLRDNAQLPRLSFSFADPAGAWFFDLRAANLTRDDQTIVAEAGRPGSWNLQVDWGEVPHNYSNKAVTPYIQRGPGLFEVPANVPITFKKLATAAADTPGVLASDDLIAAYQSGFLAPTPLGTQTNAGHFAFRSGTEAVDVGVAYDRREKSGFKWGFGPIGDRPPRTLNIQLTEPVDYRTNDLTFSAEHDGGAFQVRGEYLFSDFANKVDTLRWENVYTTAAPGADYDVWDRLVATYGERPLPPDNRYHNATVSAGVNMPAESRLMASFAYGRLEQNETLLPYASQSGVANRVLPRASADASMNTTNFTADSTGRRCSSTTRCRSPTWTSSTWATA